MQWFYEIVIALLLFSVLLFYTAIISSKYDIETDILEESSVRKNTPLSYRTEAEYDWAVF